jgi:hypothetical protein
MSEEFQKFPVLWHQHVMVYMNELSFGVVFVSAVYSK